MSHHQAISNNFRKNYKFLLRKSSTDLTSDVQNQVYFLRDSDARQHALNQTSSAIVAVAETALNNNKSSSSSSISSVVDANNSTSMSSAAVVATSPSASGGGAVVVVKKASGFQSGLLDKLNEQRLLGEAAICDLAINVENCTYYAHKCLLVASCDYFAAMMLRSGMLETRQDCIELKGVSALGLRTILDFVYTGDLKLTLANVADVIRAVSHLQVKYALGYLFNNFNSVKINLSKKCPFMKENNAAMSYIK